MQILISTNAHEDIESIFKYISHDSIKYANETVKKFTIVFLNLKDPRI